MAAKHKVPSFEEAISQLEEITRQLEKGSLSLNDSVQAYEKGMQLSALCSEMLKKAERKLEFIEANEANEEGKLEPKKIDLEEGETGSVEQSRLFQ